MTDLPKSLLNVGVWREWRRSNVAVFCVQSQRLGAVQLGAGENLPADWWDLQMRPGVPTHPPQGNTFRPVSSKTNKAKPALASLFLTSFIHQLFSKGKKWRNGSEPHNFIASVEWLLSLGSRVWSAVWNHRLKWSEHFWLLSGPFPYFYSKRIRSQHKRGNSILKQLLLRWCFNFCRPGVSSIKKLLWNVAARPVGGFVLHAARWLRSAWINVRPHEFQ